ncbi:MAG: NAD(P)-dependent oxidoreductase, partial [Amphiplicatus sp.]
DYVIVGAGAVGMAFADTLLTDTNANMILVDRRRNPGGHRNDAYPFVRLHAPAANYGVNSLSLGSDRIDEAGLNRGLYNLATGAEICSYFDQVMRRRFRPSGRVTYLPMSDWRDGVVTSLHNGARTHVVARKRVVDATYAETRVPATHPPTFDVARGALCIPPNALPDLCEPNADFVIIGAGKTAMDTAVWLIEQGADPDRITWVRPRDAWLLNRKNQQPSFDFFADTVGALAAEVEAARDASSIDDLFRRLETADLLKRIDTAVKPTMYRCAIVSDAELAEMRRITKVIRLGRVTAIGTDRIVLDHGIIPTSFHHIHINCTADGIPPKPPQPVFQSDRILLQYVRRCSPTFSGAFIAHLEATLSNDAEKNTLCTPIPVPDEPRDWLRMHVQDAKNRRLWTNSDEIQSWLVKARLDRFSAMIARATNQPTPESEAILQRYREAVQPGIARLTKLLANAEVCAKTEPKSLLTA